MNRHPTTANSREGSPARGFTLVELLVTLAITSVLLLALSSLLSVSLTQWNRQTGRHLSNSEAQWALNTLVDDLQSILPKSDGSEWLQVRAVTVENLGPTPQLMFLARPMDADAASENRSGAFRPGDVCALCYRLEKRDPFDGGDPMHALYRTVLSPEETMEQLGAENLLDAYWRGNAGETTQTDNLLGAHIIGLDLTFRIHQPDGAEETLRQGFGLRALHELRIGDAEVSPFPDGSYLRSVTIVLTTIDPAAQSLLNAGTVPLEEIVKRHGRQYSAVVEFPTPALP